MFFPWRERKERKTLDERRKREAQKEGEYTKKTFLPTL